MKMFQTTVAVCLALICVTVATAKFTGPCDLTCNTAQLIYEADLTSDAANVYDSPFFMVEQTESMPPQPIGSCNGQRLLKVTFPPATSSGIQKRRLKLVMDMDPTAPSLGLDDYSFHVADGAGVAEVFNDNAVLKVNPIVNLPGVIQPDDTFEIIIGDEYLEFTSSNGEDYGKYCDKNLFDLSEQTSDVYIAFNRPISGGMPIGHGVCKVQIWDVSCQKSKGRKIIKE